MDQPSHFRYPKWIKGKKKFFYYYAFDNFEYKWDKAENIVA